MIFAGRPGLWVWKWGMEGGFLGGSAIWALAKKVRPAHIMFTASSFKDAARETVQTAAQYHRFHESQAPAPPTLGHTSVPQSVSRATFKLV